MSKSSKKVGAQKDLYMIWVDNCKDCPSAAKYPCCTNKECKTKKAMYELMELPEVDKTIHIRNCYYLCLIHNKLEQFEEETMKTYLDECRFELPFVFEAYLEKMKKGIAAELSGEEKTEEKTTTILPLPAEWISVEDELPEKGERILFRIGTFVGEGYLSLNNEWIRFECNFEMLLNGKVTHWMPLPSFQPFAKGIPALKY